MDAAIAIADAEGLAGVSMAKVASALGFTTMSLYRHVSSKDELLALMWNASAAGIPTITGDGTRERLANWALAQMRALQRRTWILELPMATPPAGPNSLAWVEQAMAALAKSPLSAGERLGVVGLLSTFVLGEARMAHDGAIFREENGADVDYAQVLRVVADERRFPELYRAAWSGELDTWDGEAGPDHDVSGDDESDHDGPDWADNRGFQFGLERILDSIELLVSQRARSDQSDQRRRAVIVGLCRRSGRQPGLQLMQYPFRLHHQRPQVDPARKVGRHQVLQVGVDLGDPFPGLGECDPGAVESGGPGGTLGAVAQQPLGECVDRAGGRGQHVGCHGQRGLGLGVADGGRRCPAGSGRPP